jgi:hypothetical protein
MQQVMENARGAAGRHADLVLGGPPMPRERMICMSHGLVGMDRQTRSHAEMSALRACMFIRLPDRSTHYCQVDRSDRRSARSAT